MMIKWLEMYFTKIKHFNKLSKLKFEDYSKDEVSLTLIQNYLSY